MLRIVLADISTLQTLDERQIRSGLAEVFKYGIIKDAKFFKFCEENIGKLLTLDPETVEYAIKRSCQIKTRLVEQDEKEGELQAVLNFGE